ncbi:MAG: Abi family protein [Lachnospiraceae bacterium]|nr:Abi family protein [Lachnospiraceae bacterium]
MADKRVYCDMEITKPILDLDGQVKHLKDKGVRFDLMDEDAAKEYLLEHNNYFKLTAYRKNYPKHPDGKNKDKYIDLEFAYLVDLAIIDMKIRYRIVHMALDIEHHTKLLLLRKVEENCEDGYQIVQDYIDSLSEKQKRIFDSEINRNKGNIYCGNIIDKYDGAYPVWAFIEIIPLGRLVAFYGFCADRFSDKSMKNDFYRLLTCKEIRNASAHSNCILNDLRAKTAAHDTNADVTKALMKIDGMSKNFRKNRMSNARIQQVVTLLFMHRTVVTSSGVKTSESEELHKVMTRIYKHIDYYKGNPLVKNTFDFLKMVVDSWFPNE